jgi:hypothetical protein
VDELELAAAACSNFASFFRPDPKTTLREFQEYLECLKNGLHG